MLDSVVIYERIDGNQKWGWGVGRVCKVGPHICTVEQFESVPLTKDKSNVINEQLIATKRVLKEHQARFINLRSSSSDQERERRLSECMVKIRGTQRRLKFLEADSASDDSRKMRYYIPGKEQTIVCESCVLRIMDKTHENLLLSSGEVMDVENSCTKRRYKLEEELNRLNISNLDLLVELQQLECYTEALEKRVAEEFSFVSEHLVSLSNPDGVVDCGEVESLRKQVKELEAFDSRWNWEESTATVTTPHNITFQWPGGAALLLHHPEHAKFLLTAEVAYCCHVPLQCVSEVHLDCSGDKLRGSFKVTHPTTSTASEVDRRIRQHPFHSVYLLHLAPNGPKQGLDRAVAEVSRALGLPQGKYEGLYFDDFVSQIPDLSSSSDRDAYESEIGDLLMVLDRLHNENRSLQYALDKSSAEIKKQATASQKEKEALLNDTERLQDVIAKLKELADQQEQELEYYRLQREKANEARIDRNLALPRSQDDDTDDTAVYAVTVDEYNECKARAEEALASLAQKATINEALQQESNELQKALEEQRAENEALQQESNELQKALEEQRAENEALQQESNELQKALEEKQTENEALQQESNELQKTLEEQRAENEALQQESNELQKALEEKQAENEALQQESNELQKALEEQRAENEALQQESNELQKTLEEQRAENEALQQESNELQKALEEKQAENEALSNEMMILSDEVEMFRRRRNEALAARELYGGLDVPARSVEESVAASTPVTREQLVGEGLFCVTLDELKKQTELLKSENEKRLMLENRMQDILGNLEAEMGGERDDVLAQLEKLIGSLDTAREGEREAQKRIAELESEMDRERAFFGGEEERLTSELEQARGENERLQKELGEMMSKLDEAFEILGDVEATGAAGQSKLESFAEVLASAREAQKDALSKLAAKEEEVARLNHDLDVEKAKVEELRAAEEELERVTKEKLITEAEAKAVQDEMEAARNLARNAELEAAEKAKELEETKAEMNALSERVDNLVDELNEKTEQYNEIIHELDDFAQKQNREDEKELLQQLAARDQELFELQEARSGENAEHDKQVSLLQDQINRLREQLENERTLVENQGSEENALRDIISGLEEELNLKSNELAELQEAMDVIMQEHEEDIQELENALDQKTIEASDALERLEEMTAMLKEARESELIGIQRRTDSDAEIFRLQREVDQLKKNQVACEAYKGGLNNASEPK